MSALDSERSARGEEPASIVQVESAGEMLHVRSLRPDLGLSASARAPTFRGWDAGQRDGWDVLARRTPAWLLQSLGDVDENLAPLVVEPAVQEPFAALYLPATSAGEPGLLLVNPVLLAAMEPVVSDEHDRGAGPSQVQTEASPSTSRPFPLSTSAVVVHANPYSFYGSVGECAAAQRRRCESCVAAGSCDATTSDASSGLAECETLGDGDGLGYYLYCVNLSLAIATVAECVAEEVAGCPAVTSASNQLSLLEVNAAFLSESSCREGLDVCLSDLYGDPDPGYPPLPPDGGVDPVETPEPRETNVSCGDQNCELAPQCDLACGSGSCDNSFDCGGCGGSGGGCGGGCGGCSSDGSSSSGCGDGCGGDGCGGDGCGGDGCGEDGSCSSGGCGDSSGGCGGGDSGSSCGSSGGGGSCHVAHRRQNIASAAALLWALLPLVCLAWWQKRAPHFDEPHRGGLDSAEEHA